VDEAQKCTFHKVLEKRTLGIRICSSHELPEQGDVKRPRICRQITDRDTIAAAGPERKCSVSRRVGSV
jgi:hypothetical protein